MKYSRWSERINRETGIINLMNDLGNAKDSEALPLHMLGGGNPAHIPQIEHYFRNQMMDLMGSSDRFEKLVGDYAGPQGLYDFSEAVAELFRNHFGWDITATNIAVANGSQMAFTILFRLFSGEFDDGSMKQILLPLTPEYIGYNEADEHAPRFRSVQPKIEHTSDVTFKYEIDFSKIEVTDDIGAICASRPTNPTGNVITDVEVRELISLASKNGIPLVIDGAYGLPFPNIVYTDATVEWNENIILVLSLSKLGLPGTRTGIVIARKEIIELFTCANAIMTLASGNFGSTLTLKAIETGKILDLSRNVIRPYYKDLLTNAEDAIHHHFRNLPYKLHNPEGSFFVWLWFPGLPISNEELYENLKKRNVYIVPGSYFFPGLEEGWQHRYECIRVSYAGPKHATERGIAIIAEEVKLAFTQMTKKYSAGT